MNIKEKATSESLIALKPVVWTLALHIYPSLPAFQWRLSGRTARTRPVVAS